MADLRVENLKIRLGGNEILKGVSLELKRGEVTALLGPSGSGKTTLLRAVAGLEQPYDGRIEVAGKTMFDGAQGLNMATEARGLGFVFQSYALWPHRTVAQNVAYSLVLRGQDQASRDQRVKSALESLGLGHLGHRYPHELSGGQQQRVAIARALVYEPSVVLLDEPLSNLDAKLREEARAFLKELIARENLAALMVTHDQQEALAIANRILLLNGGQVEQEGTPQEMYGAPQSLFVAEFMGSNNRLEGEMVSTTPTQGRIRIGAYELDGLLRNPSLSKGHTSSAIIRIESVSLVGAAGPNVVELDLATSMFQGHVWEHVFRTAGVTIRLHHALPLSSGRHFVYLPADKLWIF
jgi:iron(III) transport system ATP-binding protein